MRRVGFIGKYFHLGRDLTELLSRQNDNGVVVRLVNFDMVELRLMVADVEIVELRAWPAAGCIPEPVVIQHAGRYRFWRNRGNLRRLLLRFGRGGGG